MLQTLHVHLLGDFRLVYGERPLTSVESPRLQTLLAYLLLHHAAPQSRQYLAFLLFPDSSEAQARTNLRNLLHLLRQALPDHDLFLTADAQTLQWRSDAPFTLDITDFEQGVTPPGPLQPRYDAKGYFVRTALGPDLMSNAKNAVRGVIDWLVSNKDLSREDAYVLCSLVAELKISQIVDAPNWGVSVYLALGVFTR